MRYLDMSAVFPIDGVYHVWTLPAATEREMSFVIFAVEDVHSEVTLKGGSRFG
jgi:hypothetical protein